MARAAEKQERLSVWLRMRQVVQPSKRKIEDETPENDSDIDVGEDDSYDSKWAFDVLPPEVLLHLLRFLDNDALKNIADVYPRCRPLIATHPKLSLYFYPKARLLRKAAKEQVVRDFIAKSWSLRSHLHTTYTYYRNITDLPTGLRRRKAKLSFFFGGQNGHSSAGRTDFLLGYAEKRLSYQRTSVIVVVATNANEVDELHDAMVFYNHPVVKMDVYDDTVRHRIATAKGKIIVLVSRISLDFPIKSMRSIILFRPMMSTHSVWALQTLDPDELVVYVRTEMVSQVFFVAHAMKTLDPHTNPVSPGNQLKLSRKKFDQIQQADLPEGMQVI